VFFKPLSLWSFVTAATGNSYRSLTKVLGEGCGEKAPRAEYKVAVGSQKTLCGPVLLQERYTCPSLALHPKEPVFLAQTNGNYLALFSAVWPYRMSRRRRYEGHKVPCPYPPGQILSIGPRASFWATPRMEVGPQCAWTSCQGRFCFLFPW
jgi:hypothetical protein